MNKSKTVPLLPFVLYGSDPFAPRAIVLVKLPRDSGSTPATFVLQAPHGSSVTEAQYRSFIAGVKESQQRGGLDPILLDKEFVRWQKGDLMPAIAVPCGPSDRWQVCWVLPRDLHGDGDDFILEIEGHVETSVLLDKAGDGNPVWMVTTREAVAVGTPPAIYITEEEDTYV